MGLDMGNAQLLIKKEYEDWDKDVEGYTTKDGCKISLLDDYAITQTYSICLHDSENDKWEIKYIKKEEYDFLVKILGVTEEK